MVPRQEGGQFGGLGGAVCAGVVGLAAPVPLAIVSNWLGAQPPRNGNSGTKLKEDGVGTLVGVELKGCRWGEIQSGFLLLKPTSNPLSHITILFLVAFLLGAHGGCIRCWKAWASEESRTFKPSQALREAQQSRKKHNLGTAIQLGRTGLTLLLWSQLGGVSAEATGSLGFQPGTQRPPRAPTPPPRS